MKNGLYWFSKLDKREQIAFCRNVINYSTNPKLISEYLLRDFDSFADFILSAFSWSSSPEGAQFWSRICYKL